MALGKLTSFDKLDVAYATVNGQPLQATVLTPRSLREKPPGSTPSLSIGMAAVSSSAIGSLSRNAIIISPDYRLLPEATGSDILEDVQAFWRWVSHELPALSEAWHARPDLDSLACCGESAGGWLSVQSALLFPAESRIRAVISSSAPLHADIPQFTIPQPRTIMGSRAPPARQAERVIRSYLGTMKPGAVKVGCDPSEMWEMVMCIMQQAWLPRLMSAKTDRRLDVMENLAKAGEVPPMWIIHGLQDSFAPSVCSTEFAKRVQTMRADVPFWLSLQPGDHMFDASMSMDEEWVQSGCHFLSQHWP
ncbi:hypothetical protein PG993_014033 [Apiospora rasikravindrae]|uniref:Alpha/beta hydrolase fold-3 domain-containing protein n=1 Tax=Apiospora rasikravindrae TaxID=990691 RepID=A0ABR1RSB6_9PEZI